jgi:hypothetical protein
MPFASRYIYTASMDIDADHEALFEEVYDTEHLPAVLDVPGVLAVARFRTEPATVVIGGRTLTLPSPADEPRFTALYEIDSPEILSSDAWAQAIDVGRWPAEVRPHASNRRIALRRLVYPGE